LLGCERRAALDIAGLTPTINVLFCTEDEHRASRVADVVPPMLRRDSEVNDSLAALQLPGCDLQQHRFATVYSPLHVACLQGNAEMVKRRWLVRHQQSASSSKSCACTWPAAIARIEIGEVRLSLGRKSHPSDVGRWNASVRQYCKALRMPVIGTNFVQLAEQAVKEQPSHIGYLEALLAMETEERDRHGIQKRLHDAKLPRLKTLEEFDFNQARQIPAAKIRELTEGGYITRAEPVAFMGECGTGNTHLATGLCVAASRQKRRARFTTAANLVNELVEARQNDAVKRVLVRWLRYDVIVLDDVGYVPLAEIGAEFLFQVIAERAERATLIVTTNLPFSEWTRTIPNFRAATYSRGGARTSEVLKAFTRGMEEFRVTEQNRSTAVRVFSG
jgi:DNA replication protein DnaC